MQTHRNPSAAAIHSALLQVHESDLDPVDEMIAIGEAVFNLIRLANLEPGVKDAFYQLEKQFGFYALMMESDGR